MSLYTLEADARRRSALGDLGVRLAVALLAPQFLLVLVLFVPVLALLGPYGMADEILSIASRFLNVAAGGPATATESAFAWQRLLDGEPGAAARVRLIDAINYAGHCEESWADPRNRGHLALPASKG